MTVGSEDIDHLVPEIWPSSRIKAVSKGAVIADDILSAMTDAVILVGDIARWQLASRFLTLKPDFLAIHFAGNCEKEKTLLFSHFPRNDF